MPHLSPAHFQRLIGRHGERIAWYPATPAMSLPVSEADWGNRVAPGAGAPGEKRGWIYKRRELPLGVKVWIYSALQTMGQGAGGVAADGESRIVWMPGQIALSRPDRIVRIEQEISERERVAWLAPLSSDATFGIRVSRDTAFALSTIARISSEGIEFWPAGPCWSAEPSGEPGEFQVSWYGPEAAPTALDNLAVEFKYHPAFYFLGENTQPRRRAKYGGLLPRSGSLSLTHPGDEPREVD